MPHEFRASAITSRLKPPSCWICKCLAMQVVASCFTRRRNEGGQELYFKSALPSTCGHRLPHHPAVTSGAAFLTAISPNSHFLPLRTCNAHTCLADTRLSFLVIGSIFYHFVCVRRTYAQDARPGAQGSYLRSCGGPDSPTALVSQGAAPFTAVSDPLRRCGDLFRLSRHQQ
jgi:hypothetical protein